MEYTVQKLARLAGVSARTLRFYDEIGLLCPARISSNGYRIYGDAEVDTLQQILFFRALGLELGAIAQLMQSPDFDRVGTLQSHLASLREKRAQLDLLIDNVQKTIEKEEGVRTMTDAEKFAGFKQQLVDENEQNYGKEIREKYGDKTVDESNRRMLKMSKADYDTMRKLEQDILDHLAVAIAEGKSPDSETGREIALAHKGWLGYSWPEYSKEAHLNLSQMYVEDERFTAYYDKQAPGSAQFLRDALHAWQDAL